MTELMQAPTTASGLVVILLPCGHHRARIRGTEVTSRRCRTCRKYYLIEYQSGDVAKVTNVTCWTCGGMLRWVDSQWFCTRCGDEFHE